ncbi:asparagine synthase (glutamine-hydrolyzing) [Helicobacter valdiviensis]|uniref:asparagine synthase (glutamine-hydrolyzing) n=1 Tax=Helicobacter valdiviensis TaxID=1458358 RepID=A0A2W6MXE7_9HELI|nr:asparagine synthase (glutamine-hydrolyzing) [Helicobacter valdiviensis]PZT48649.1 asparagine synthase (glutamine-hydrolyzing) [Helicobacter valdiviensis]
MCAIVGIYGENSSLSTLDSMLEALKMRGLDCRYIKDFGNFKAGMNRLSINDIEGGIQPFCNRHEDIFVFFNGEIYNHKDLRSELEREGIVFSSTCDGEVLPYLYEKYGRDCFSLLDGMFAICVYELKSNKIILARDSMGEKPLYYYKDSKNFAFGSLISSLRQIANVSLNKEAIWDYFTFGFIPENQCIYNEICVVPRGGILEFFDGGISITKFTPKVFIPNLSEDSLVSFAREVVTKSVRDRLLSDCRVGAFLSGGLDSSIVCALAKDSLYQSFNISFLDDFDPYCSFANEGEYAKEVAKFLGLSHTEVKVSSSDFLESLDNFIDSIDQPFGVVSGIGIKMIAKIAKEMGIKVLLSGDGADECFGGYAWYPKLAFNDPKFITKEKPKGWHYYAYESEKREFCGEFFDKTYNSLRHFPYFDFREITPLDCINFDREFYLKNEMMMKLDRMTMSEGVEGRACFVSPLIVEFSKKLSYEILLKNGTKWLLKEAFKDCLPLRIIEREKHGFNPPIDYWMQTSWRGLLNEVLSPQNSLVKNGIIKSREDFYGVINKRQVGFGSIAFFVLILGKWLEKEKM